MIQIHDRLRRSNRITVVMDDPLLALLKFHSCRMLEEEGLCDGLSSTIYKILWRYLSKKYPKEVKEFRRIKRTNK